MSKKDSNLRIGFHSIESIVENTPEIIKKVILPAKRNDQRLNNLKTSLEKAGISFENSSKLKQEPEAYIKEQEEKNFKDLKGYINAFEGSPLLLILDNVIDPRNLGACIRSAGCYWCRMRLL
jgi:23S rRNA (guanosine2251-2'-O)-methyltransferase